MQKMQKTIGNKIGEKSKTKGKKDTEKELKKGSGFKKGK